MKRIYWTLTLFFAGMLAGCDRDDGMPQLERPSRAETEEDRLKDSVYVYTYGFYLWQEHLPDWHADVRAQTARFNSADAVLEELKGYARDAAGNPYDRFSFLDRWGTVNAEIQQGMAGSFGIDVRYMTDDDLYVKRVDIGSPAYQAGIQRGWQILEVNGQTDLSLANMERDNFEFLFGALDAEAIGLRLRRPDGSEVSLDLDRRTYQLQPILAHQIFTAGGKKVGYFAFDIFVSTLDDRDNPTYVKTQLDQLVRTFEEAGVQELIVDLRYNGGGAVITADYLSNLLAPRSADGQLMYTNKSNGSLENFLASKGSRIDLSPVYYRKTNTLDVTRIYFLVTEGTASASELVINNLKPYVDTKLIGEYATYGKPVGYFPWNIRGVDLYAVSFQTFNAKGYGEYFSGLPVDKQVFDDLTRDFGDPEEAMIAEALHYVQHGGFSAATLSRQAGVSAAGSTQVSPHRNGILDRHSMKGMFIFRH
jgi:Periplasmic protease